MSAAMQNETCTSDLLRRNASRAFARDREGELAAQPVRKLDVEVT